jgi:hypothetical protein
VGSGQKDSNLQPIVGYGLTNDWDAAVNVVDVNDCQRESVKCVSSVKPL